MIGFFGKKDITFQEIKELYLKGQIKKAISSCESYLKKNPNDFDAMNLLGEMYYKSGDKNRFIALSLELAKKLESERYFEKAAAVLRKGIKYYPDYQDFYRSLAKIFAAKGLLADQIGVLKELASLYEKNGEIEKFLGVLFEIFELDRSNYNFIKYLIDKLKKYKKIKELCRCLPEAVEGAKKNNDNSFLYNIIEDGIANKCSFGRSIKYTVDYFKANRGKVDIFVKEATDYLMREFDSEIFKQLVSFAPYEQFKETYLDIYHKYTEPEIFSFLLPNFIKEDTEKISTMFEKLKESNDKKIDKAFGDLFYNYLDQIPVDRYYDNLLLIAKLTDHNELKGKVVSLAGKKEEYTPPPKGAVLDLDLLDKIDKTEMHTAESDIPSFLERTDYSVSDEAESVNVDLGDIKNEKFDVELDLSEFLNLSDASKEGSFQTKSDSALKEDLFELDLSEHVEESDLSLQPQEISQEHLDNLTADFFDEIVHKESEEELIKVDFSSEIKEIKELIETGKYEYAKVKLEDLLLLDPENDELKDLAVRVYSISTFDINEEKSGVEGNILELDQETKKVIKAIKESIEKTVSHDDYEMHYDLAQAYMEMELFEEAIEELKKSAYGKFKYKSLILLVECYKRMKRYSEAIDMLKLIILDFGKDNEILKNCIYELGELYEIMGDITSSKSHFMKLCNMDPDFRDVKNKLDSLDVTIGTSSNSDDKRQSELPPNKKKKISFM